MPLRRIDLEDCVKKHSQPQTSEERIWSLASEMAELLEQWAGTEDCSCPSGMPPFQNCEEHGYTYHILKSIKN